MSPTTEADAVYLSEAIRRMGTGVSVEFSGNLWLVLRARHRGPRLIGAYVTAEGARRAYLDATSHE